MLTSFRYEPYCWTNRLLRIERLACKVGNDLRDNDSLQRSSKDLVLDENGFTALISDLLAKRYASIAFLYLHRRSTATFLVRITPSKASKACQLPCSKPLSSETSLSKSFCNIVHDSIILGATALVRDRNNYRICF